MIAVACLGLLTVGVAQPQTSTGYIDPATIHIKQMLAIFSAADDGHWPFVAGKQPSAVQWMFRHADAGNRGDFTARDNDCRLAVSACPNTQ